MSHDSSREFFVIPETITLEGEVCPKQQALDDVKISKDTGCEAGVVVDLTYTLSMQVAEAQGSLLVLGKQGYNVRPCLK